MIVLPYRYGDILNALPIAKKWHEQGHVVYWVAHQQFCDLFDGVSYVRPIPYDGKMNDVRAACDFGKSVMATCGVTAFEIYPLKSGDFVTMLTHPTEHFSAELWERAGELHEYHALPLEIDRRDPRREYDLARSLCLRYDQHILPYCFKGHSFGYKHAAQLEQWLIDANAAAGEPWQLINLSEIRGYRLYDLLGLLSRSHALLAIDTSVVHLARAVQLPTVVVVQERDYDSPEPHRHWIGSVRGNESITAAGQAKMHRWLFEWTQKQRMSRRGYLCRETSKMYAKPILFGVTPPKGEIGVEGAERGDEEPPRSSEA
jgi:hypothetical protein